MPYSSMLLNKPECIIYSSKFVQKKMRNMNASELFKFTLMTGGRGGGWESQKQRLYGIGKRRIMPIEMI